MNNQIRDEDRKQQCYWERKGVPAYANLYRLAAQEKTKQMRPLYQEIRMCEETIQAEPRIRALFSSVLMKKTGDNSGMIWGRLRKRVLEGQDNDYPQCSTWSTGDTFVINQLFSPIERLFSPCNYYIV